MPSALHIQLLEFMVLVIQQNVIFLNVFLT